MLNNSHIYHQTQHDLKSRGIDGKQPDSFLNMDLLQDQRFPFLLRGPNGQTLMI
jgi:hypothetical protein